MAISSSTRKAGPFIGNDATTVFPFAFKVFTSADLRVVRTNALGVESDLVLDTDYTVALNANQDNDPGGTVTRATALPTGERLTITSDVEALQPLVLTNNGGFYPRVINDAFDKITIIAQQLIEQVGRSLKLPISSTASATLPDPVANRLIAWNSSANGFTNVDPASIATVAAYADASIELFDGNGTQTAFTLAEDPAVLANLDVSISGVVQVGGEDFTWIGTTLTFVVAPPTGTRIQVRYTRAIPPVDLAAAVAAAEADRVATAADRVQTGLDRVATAADREQTGLDVIAAEADRVATSADRVQTGLDRVQTGADVVATAASAAAAANSAAMARPTVFTELTIGTSSTNSAFLEFVNPSLDLRTNIPASRGELRLIPNDSTGRDADAGGELTLVGNDTEGADALAGNQAVGVVYIRRVAGVNTSLLLRTLAYGDEPQLPIEFSADGGTLAARFETDNTFHALYPMVIEPTYFPATRAPTLTLKGEVASVLLDDTEGLPDSRQWEILNSDGDLSFVDQLAVATRFRLDTSGDAYLGGTLTAGGIISGVMDIAAAAGPNAGFRSTNTGAELSVKFYSKDTGGQNNEYSLSLGKSADGQFGVYDTTGGRFTLEFRRTTPGSAGGRWRFYDPIQLDNAYQAGAPTPTGYLVLYDSAGVAYKVPAVAV